MAGILIFAIALIAAVLVSGYARRSILSTAVLFLVAGIVAGKAGFQFIVLNPSDPLVSRLVELALFSVLFTEGTRVDWNHLRSAWRLPGRALIPGLPITMGLISLLAHWIAGLSWIDALLVGAVLCPTDPVFAEAIVGREGVPRRLKHLLNVESGLNDGLALPAVLILLSVASHQETHVARVLIEVVFGVAIGIAIPWVIIRLEQSKFFSAVDTYEPLLGFAVGVLVLAVSSLTGANEFLAAFAAGITMAAVGEKAKHDFLPVGNVLAELFKLAALLVFGSLIARNFPASIPLSGYVFAALVLIAVRPAALACSLAGASLAWREWVAAAWFGPRGFASVLYALLVLKSGLPEARQLNRLAALVIVASIVAHSSTDVLIARWLMPSGDDQQQPHAAGDPDPESPRHDRP